MLDQNKIAKQESAEFFSKSSLMLGESSNMEGMRLSTRRTFFLLYGVASLFLFLASTYYADARINDAILEWKRSQELVKLISEIHEAVTLIEAKKDVFLQGARSPSIESVEKNLKEVLIKLRKIHQFPESKAVSPVVSTLRDGLLQYNDQFSKITKIKDGKATKLLNGTINKDAVISKSGLEEFGEILAYVMPNMEQLILFSGKLSKNSINKLNELREKIRLLFPIFYGILIVLIVVFGSLIMRNMIKSIRTVSNTASRIASGEENAIILGTENIDSVGQIARTLMKWRDDLSDMRQIRLELNETRKKLSVSLQEADRKASATVDAARAALIAEVASDKNIVGQSIIKGDSVAIGEKEKTKIVDSNATRINDSERELVLSEFNSISSASQTVAHLSGFVTTATTGFERVDQLIKSLKQITMKIELIGTLLTYIKELADQEELPVQTDYEPKRSIDLTNVELENPKLQEEVVKSDEIARRLVSIRDVSKRADKVGQELKESILESTKLANDLASTTSSQALDATKRLLLQSQNLQNILDNIIHEIGSSRSDQADTRSNEKNSET